MSSVLYRYHDAIWFDRFQISPEDNWGDALLDARQQASHVIVVLSSEYLKTDYCRDEYQYFFERDIPIIAVIAEDIPVSEFSAHIQVVDWIDFRNWSVAATFQKTIEQILDRLPKTTLEAHQSERKYYLYSLIEDLENTIAKIPTSRASFQSYHGIEHDSQIIRPRGYDLNLLEELEFAYQDDTGTLDVDSLQTWFETQHQFMLMGKAGSGKTVIAQLLVLWMAHQALNDNQAILPFWFNLALWSADQSIESFIETQWPLAYYWKHWLDAHEALIVFDNVFTILTLNQHDIDAFHAQLDALSNHRLILLLQETLSTNLTMPIATIGYMPNHKMQRFSRAFLDDSQVGVVKRLIRDHSAKLEFSQIDFLSCGIELLSHNMAEAVDTWFIDPVVSLITLRWEAHQDELDVKFSLDYFIKTMRILAWHMVQPERRRFIAREEAEHTVFQPLCIKVAITLGILEVADDKVYFQAEMFQWYLATDHLVQDGIYKHLLHPQFSKTGTRQPTKLDDIIFALIDTVSGKKQQQILNQIAEIDPYLGWLCIQQHPDLYDVYLQPLIAKLIDMRSKNPESQTAFTKILSQIPYVEETAINLVTQMPQYDWGIQQWIWVELLRLPIDIPIGFVNQVKAIDREFSESASSILSNYSLPRSVAYLSHLINHRNPQVQLNAIWLAGELKHSAIKVGLFMLLDNESLDIRQATIHALANIMDEQLAQKLLMWLAKHLEHSGDVGHALYNMERYVSGRILLILHANQLRVDDGLRNAIIKHPEERIANAIIDYIAKETNQPDLLDGIKIEREDIVKVEKLLQFGLQHLPRDSFNRLVEDIHRVIGVPVDEKEFINSDNETLYERTQSALAAATVHEPAETQMSYTSIPDKLLAQLQGDTWKERRSATNQLANYHAEVALPLLLKSAQDEDEHVKIAALNLLANFTDNADAQQALVDALFDDDYLVVDTSADLLKSSDILQEDDLNELLQSDRVQTLAAVMDMIAHKPYEMAVEYLIPYLGNQEKPWLGEKILGDYATDALIAIGTSEALEAVNRLNHETEDIIPGETQSVQDEEDTTPTDSGKKSYTTIEKVELCIKALSSDNWDLAQKSARFLNKLSQKLRGTNNRKLIHKLCVALSDPDWHVRWAVTESLAWIQHPSAIPHLGKGVDDPNWIVQTATIRALVELSASDYAPNVAKLLKNPNNAVREAAAEALASLNNPSVVPALTETMLQDDDFIRLASMKSIHHLVGDNQIDHLMMGLKDDYVHIRWFAIKHLVPHINTQNYTAITPLLGDLGKPSWEDMSIHNYAVEALTNIDVPEAKSLLANWNEQNV